MNASSDQLITQLQHLGTARCDADYPVAPVAMPSMRTSTVRFNSIADLNRVERAKSQGERAVSYGRMGMDTHYELEKIFCALEGAERTFLASSGVGAITMALMSLLSQGDHLLSTDNVYGPVREVHEHVLSRMGIEADFCPGNDLEALRKALKPSTRVLYAESPGSLLMEMLDLPKLAAFAREHELILVVDNTWGSGVIYRPLELGADVSIISGTKYVGGHSDLMLGAVAVRDPDLIRRIHATQYAMGYSVSADDAWLAIRGVRTLPVRLAQHARNAMALCAHLQTLPVTQAIFHPAHPDDAGHALWQRDATGSNGLLSVALDITGAQARAFADNLRLFSIGYSWGGFESLVQWVHPSQLRVHSYWNNRQAQLLRFHVGLEAPEDLAADISQAWSRAADCS